MIDTNGGGAGDKLALKPDDGTLRLHRDLCDPSRVTEKLRELVPLLRFVGFQAEQITPEKTILSVPLLETSMNLNGTHQATIFYLIADYTLGIGMFATLPGCYVVGIHDLCNALPVQFWLKSGRVEHLRAGTGTLRSELSIEPARVIEMRKQLATQGRCELKDKVRIYQGTDLVAIAEHEMELYADHLRTQEDHVTAVQLERRKTSALIIAALRGDSLSRSLAGLRGDALSRSLAGDQGLAIGLRISRASPQLPHMVAARTKHLRTYLNTLGAEHTQVLVLGVGFDAKPLEFAGTHQMWFICDLEDMLRERDRRLTELGQSSPHVVNIPVDLRLDNWPTKIREAGYDPHKSTLVILEGASMYLRQNPMRRISNAVRGLLLNTDSRFWLDHVTAELLTMDRTEVKSFLAAMSQLGEPVISGFSDATVYCGNDKWSVLSSETAGTVLHEREEIYRAYRFSILKPEIG